MTNCFGKGTSPPTKIIGHRELINPTLAVLKLGAKYLVTTIYSNMQQKKRPMVNRRTIAETWRRKAKRGQVEMWRGFSKMWKNR